MLDVAAVAENAADGLAAALSGGHAWWILAAISLHLVGQVSRGIAWHQALAACWPGITRSRACAWYVCGCGLSGVLSARGGDVVRIGLAKREVPGSTWTALAGTLTVEGGAQVLVGLPVVLIALAIGVNAAPQPSATLALAIAAAIVVLSIAASRLGRVRSFFAEFARGFAALRDRGDGRMPRIFAWELAARLLRLGAVGCFLYAFGLPTSVASVVTVAVVYSSGATLPVPGAGTAASAGALLVALPVAAGHSVDAAAVTALVIAQPVVLTMTGLGLSLSLLGVLLGPRTLAALLRARRSPIAEPSSSAA